MSQKTTLLVAALSALITLPACAADAASAGPVTSNVSIVSNYVYRGISRTAGNPAVQGGVDLAATNGVYVGAWGSNISWVADSGMATGSSLELDVYAGVKNRFLTGFFYDLGVIRYHYPARYNAGAVNADTNELQAALGYQWLAVKYSYSPGNTFGIADSKGSSYLNVTANYPIPDSSFTLGAHYGKQSFRGTEANALKLAGRDPSYTDYSASISWNVSGYVLGLTYSGTNTTSTGYYLNAQGAHLGKKAFIFSLRRTF